MKNYYPDLVISYGGALISKFLKKALRDYPPQRHWHIGEADRLIDTYGAMTRKVKINPDKFFVQLTEKVVSNNSAYAKNWQKLSQTADLIHDEFLKNMPWCDFKAFSVIVPMLPKESRLQLSNGTSVRYHQLFKNGKTSRVDANRGTSGIEGSTSTAAGGAYMFEGVTTLITGDVSFLYDSNALWNKRLSRNLRIIILNNNGGGIFRFIKGPSDVPEMEDFFETPHNVDIAKLAEAYGVNYLSAQNERELRMSMKTLYAWNKTTILEIKTPRFINDEILRSYYKQSLNGK